MKQAAARVLLCVAAAVCLPACAQANGLPKQWVEATTIGVPVGNAKEPVALFANSYTNAGPLAGVWTRVYVEQFGVPADAKAVFLSGILIITHGIAQETADITVSFRACGDQLPAQAYSGQTVEAHVGGGQRSGVATWVPLNEGCLEWIWSRSTPGNWPSNSAYGVNMSLQAYVR